MSSELQEHPWITDKNNVNVHIGKVTSFPFLFNFKIYM